MNRHNKSIRSTVSLLAVASTFIATVSRAQETPLAPSKDANSAPASKVTFEKSGEIQSVVVTAQKRKEDASKVPISISVIGGEELAAQHIGDYADITRAIPNVSFSGGGGGGDAGDGPGLSNIEIRGISSSAGSATVGIYQDDISMTVSNQYSMGSAEPKFFDLDRVEVLRGPQGTLYGASSMGGTIKFITNQPDLKERETTIYTEASSIKGGGVGYNANAVFNQPLIPGELALRFGVSGEHQGGFINLVNGTGAVTESGINWQDAGVVRFAMKWAPSKELTLTPSVFYQKVKTGDTDVSYSQLITNNQPTGIALPNYQISKMVREPGMDELLVPSLTVNYEMGFGDLTSVSSFFKRNFQRHQDGSFTNSNVLGNNYIIGNPALASAIAVLPSVVKLENQIQQYSQEVRIASKPYQAGGSPVTWLVGGYVSSEHTNIFENDPILGINSTFAQYGASPTDPNVLVSALPVGFPGDNTFHGEYKVLDTQQSLFGEMNYYFEPTLHATAGLRYLHAAQTYDTSQSLYFSGSYPPSEVKSSGTKATPKVSLTWEVSPTDSLFASAAEGFRVGGANPPIPVSVCKLTQPSPISYKSDSLWSYEVGDKSRFLNNTVALNASAFYVKWKSMQQNITLACNFNYDINVGDATSYGGEIELKVKPVKSILLGLSGGVTHAVLDNSNAANAGLYGAVKGESIPGVPKFNAVLTAQYDFNLGEDAYGFVRGAARWVGSSHGGFALLPNGGVDPDYIRPAYNTFDASTGISWNNWDATLFVKNLLNNDKVIQRPIVQSTLGEVYRIEPRIIGVSLSTKF
ncbi:TonB-dependent receptor [Sapientia aquatica]|uniref:TonB-dependent receptor n=1 Tax=Sapientia aquatica TaxID=1549640 RepID=A0A4R5VNJ8_9BURK|nr:TonB-dependent receptor [Sapientia aquatica]TDK59653.1 TonB-dependent receptor [Sapientia aquatica]